MIDAKKAFRKILREWGHDVYIQRRQNNGDYCNKFERFTTRHVGQSGLTNTLSLNEYPEGLDVKYDSVYYFEAEAMPKEGDRIYEDFSAKKGKDSTMLVVAACTPTRGRQGKILFWTVGANRER